MAKRISILAAVAIVAVVFWLLAKPLVANPDLSLGNYQSWLLLLVVLILLIAVTGLSFALLGQRWWQFSSSLLAGLPMLWLLGLTPLYLLALAAILLFHWRAIAGIGRDLAARTSIDMQRVIGASASSVLVPILIGVSFAYFASPTVQVSAKNGQLPSAVARAVQSAARKVAAVELGTLPPAQRVQAENQIVRIVLGQINAWAKPYIQYLPPVLAFGLFLVLEGLSFIFVPLAALTAAGIFVILKRTGFVVIETKDVKAEVLALS